MKAEIIKRFIFTNIILCALALLLFITCITCKSGSNIGKITFWCFDQNGGLVQEAKLTINGQKFVADAEGKCLFQADMEEESVELLISADEREGYRFLGPTQVSLKKNEHSKYSIYFFRDYRFTFQTLKVLNGTRTPLNNIPISLNGQLLGKTGRDGAFITFHDAEVTGGGLREFKARYRQKNEIQKVTLNQTQFNYDVKFEFPIAVPTPTPSPRPTISIDTGIVLHTIVTPTIQGGGTEKHKRKFTWNSSSKFIEIKVRGENLAKIPLNLKRGGAYQLICNFRNRTATLHKGGRKIFENKTF